MEIFKDFGVEPVLILGQIVNFLILLFILKKIFFKPILNHLEKRRKIIEEGLRNAQEAQKIIEKAKKEYQETISKAKAEFNQILEDARIQANKITYDAQLKAQKNVEAMLQEAREKIAQDRINLENEVKKDMVRLVAIAVEKVTKGLITRKQSEEYTRSSLLELYQHEQKTS
ncbi:MAG: F0F1 ATP synthase subunit B [Patescibacteria group bacterium]|nr:F0F1 ATP synthase subunit B [Patescibacteria group bacterium]